MNPNSRLDNLISWLAASVVVTAGVIFALQRHEGRREPVRVLARATPAQEPLGLQEIRATERGRGRRARSPSQIPWRGWKDIVLRTYLETQEDRLLALAAGVVFYSLVALFPAIAAGVSFYALFADAGTIGKHLSLAAGVVPAEVLDMLRDEISRISAKSDGKLTFGLLLGLGIALWSANAGMKAVFDALNIIYDEQESRGIVRLNLISLFFTVCAIGAVLLAVSAVVVFPLVLAALGLASVDEPIIGYSALAGDVPAHPRRPRGALSLRSEPTAGEMAVDQCRQHRGGDGLARGLLAVLLVSRQLRQLQRDLRGARRRGRPDDVDVALHHRGPGRRRAEFRDRAPDLARLDGGAGEAARRTRRRHGRHGGCGEVVRALRAGCAGSAELVTLMRR